MSLMLIINMTLLVNIGKFFEAHNCLYIFSVAHWNARDTSFMF